MGTYKTSQIAKLSGIHVNTVRLYEQQRLIPEAPRAGNGYRLYGDLHLEHVLLVRAAFMSTWLGGTIRKKAYAVLLLAADGNHEKAMQEAQEHLALVVAEREKAETAVRYLESWAIMYDEPGPRLHWKTGDVCQYLNITRDTLRSWERNGLIAAQRDPDNGYRCYSENDLRRLYVIRALRKARFSLMSVYRMLQQYDQGVRDDLGGILNELPPEEEDIFYNTDQWLSKIKLIEESAREMINRLNTIKACNNH